MEFPKAPVTTFADGSDPYVSDHVAGSLVMIPDAPPRPRPRSSEFFMPYEPIPPQSATFPDHPPLAPEMNAVLETATESVPTAEGEMQQGKHGFIRFEEGEHPVGSPEPLPKKPGKKGVGRENEAPRFHNPKTLRFFDPVAAAAERDGESPDEASGEIGPRPSIELSPELKAAIIQMDEQLRQRREQQQKTPPPRVKKKWWSQISKRPLEEKVVDRTAARPFAEPLSITPVPAAEAASVELPFEAASDVVPAVAAETSERVEAALSEFPAALSFATAVEESKVEEQLPTVTGTSQADKVAENTVSAEPEAVALIDEPAVAPVQEALAASDAIAAPTIDLAGTSEAEVVTAATVEESFKVEPVAREIEREAIPAAPATTVIAAQEMSGPAVATSASAEGEAEVHLGPTAEAEAESLAEIDSVRPWLAGAPVTVAEQVPVSATPVVDPAAEQVKAAEPSSRSRPGRKKPFWSRMAPVPQVEAPPPAAEPTPRVAKTVSKKGPAARPEPEQAPVVAKPVESRPAYLEAVRAPAVAAEEHVPAPGLKIAADAEPLAAARTSNVEVAREPLKMKSTPVAPVVEIQPVHKKRVWPSGPPAKVLRAQREVAPEVVEKEEPPPQSKQRKEKEQKERLSLGARFQRWLVAGEPAGSLLSLDGKRNGKRENMPGLVAFYFSGGTPRPHEILNISKTGLYMRTHEIWSADTMVRMTLQRPDIHKTISVLTRVVRIDDGGVGHAFITSEVLSGLRVRDVMPEHGTNQKELDDFLAAAASEG